MRYYNKTIKPIPYICTNFISYVQIDTLSQHEYIKGVPTKGKLFASFELMDGLFLLMKIADFKKLTLLNVFVQDTKNN